MIHFSAIPFQTILLYFVLFFVLSKTKDKTFDYLIRLVRVWSRESFDIFYKYRCIEKQLRIVKLVRILSISKVQKRQRFTKPQFVWKRRKISNIWYYIVVYVINKQGKSDLYPKIVKQHYLKIVQLFLHWFFWKMIDGWS